MLFSKSPDWVLRRKWKPGGMFRKSFRYKNGSAPVCCHALPACRDGVAYSAPTRTRRALEELNNLPCSQPTSASRRTSWVFAIFSSLRLGWLVVLRTTFPSIKLNVHFICTRKVWKLRKCSFHSQFWALLTGFTFTNSSWIVASFLALTFFFCFCLT